MKEYLRRVDCFALTLLVSYLWQASGYLKIHCQTALSPDHPCHLNVSTASSAGGDRMTSFRQSVDRGNADRCFAVDSADTVEPHERCWILIGLLVEAVT